MTDDYETPRSAWDQIAHLIPKTRVIWEAFYLNGNSGEYLRELGFEVIHENLDFFTHDFGDVVVSNPPFSRKQAILKRLVELNKPFILLMPVSVLTTEYIRCVPGLQIVVPPKRIQFIREGVQTTSCSFGCVYYCWKIGLEKDMILL